MCVLKQQVAEIYGESHTLFRERRAEVLIDRELSAEADGVVVKYAQCCGAKEHLVSLGVCYRDITLQESVGAFSNKFAKESPIPLVRWSAPLRGTIAVDQTVIEDIGPLVPVVLIEPGVRSAQPKVLAARRRTTDYTDHRAGHVRCMCNPPKPRLRAGDDETCKASRLDSSANPCGSVLETP